MAGKLFQYNYLFRLLLERDLKERYAGSWLGMSWSLLQPTVLFCTYYLVFSVVLHLKPDPAYQGVPFALWMMAGLAPWLFIAEILARSPASVTDHARMVTKNAFPNGLLPTVTFVSALTNHLLTMALLVVYLSWKGTAIVSVMRLIPWMALLALLGLGIAWIFAAVGVYFRDLGQLAGLLAMAWSFATPIFYPEQTVPQAWSWILWANPACLLVRGYRAALLGPDLPGFDGFGTAALWSAAVLALGMLVFRRLKLGFPDLL